MGLFDIVKNDYNKALDHYQQAKSSPPLSTKFIEELDIAAGLLRNSINRNDGTADCLVVLSNIFFAVFSISVSTYQDVIAKPNEYLLLSAAIIQHWKKGWRGYNKNSQQGNQLYSMITTSVLQNVPPHLLSNGIEFFMDSIHDHYFQEALIKKIGT